MNMKSMEDQLPSEKFIRIHKSYIVAIQHLSAIRKNSVFIGDNELPIGDNYREIVNKITGRQP
jgi:DNA-binding LytR/AlgR family response regulator